MSKPKIVPKIVDDHPAETTAGTVGTVVSLALVLLHLYGHWDVPNELQPYVPVIVGWIAGAVTWFKLR